MIRKSILVATLLMTASSPIFASGTPEEQAACRPDVLRFCRALKADASDSDYLACLEAHRPHLRSACRAVLSNHGQ